MKRVTTFLVCAIALLMAIPVLAQVLGLTTLTNADFTADDAVVSGIRTYEKDIVGNDVSHMQEVTGWTIAVEENGDARAAGIFKYGSKQFLGSPTNYAPILGPDGGADGKALGLLAVWSATVQYKQTVNLPAGKYIMVLPIFNESGANEVAANLIGIDGTYATNKTYAVGKWTIEKVSVNIEEAKDVEISLGYTMTNTGNGNSPHLFIDNVKLFTDDGEAATAIGEMEIAAQTANEAIPLAIAKRNALATVDELQAVPRPFDYPSDAISKAKLTIKHAESVEVVETALAELNAAQNKPAADKVYAITNKTAKLNLGVSSEGVKLQADSTVRFTEVEDGWVISNNAESSLYILKTATNDWTLSTTANKDEAYAVKFKYVLAEGAFTIQGAKGLLGTDNVDAGSDVYANKSQDKNGLWTIAEVFPKPVEVPENADVQKWTLTGKTVSSSTSVFDYPTEVAFDGSDVYVKGLYPYGNKDMWVKGTIADGKATFAAKQIIEISGAEAYYILGSTDGETISDFVLTYDAEAKTLTQETQYIYLNYDQRNTINPEYLESWQDLKLTFGVEEPVAAPEELSTSAYNLSTTIYYSEEETEAYEVEVQVGFDGNDVYIQGISSSAPQFWIKATKNDEGKYVVPALQYMGETTGWRKMKYYFSALDAENNFVDAVFTYDAEANTFTTEQKLVINRGKETLNPDQTFGGTTTIVKAPEVVDTLVVLPETADVQTWTLTGKTVGSSTSIQEYATQVAFEGNDIYIKGLFPYQKDTWVKGTLYGQNAVFESGQLIADYGVEKYYIIGSFDGAEASDDFGLIYDAEAKTLTQSTPYIYLNYQQKNTINQEYLESWQDLKLTFGVEEPVTAPEELSTVAYNLSTTIYYSEEETEAYETEVQVGFDGNDVYVQGIAPNAPQMWIKATKNDEGKYVVPALQYMGETTGWRKMKYYFSALDAENNFVDAVFTYDAEANIFTTEQKMVINRGKGTLNPDQTFGGTTTIKIQQSTDGVLASGTYYTVGGKFYVYTQSGFQDATSEMSSVEVTVEGTTVKIAGLAYYFKENAIEGTINGNIITFANGQLVGSDGYGDEFLVASNDGETVAENIVFTYDAETKTLSSNQLIIESAAADAIQPYAYWQTPAFSTEEPVAPEVVVLPEEAKVEEYSMTYEDKDGNSSTKPVNVAVVGNDVYFQGLSQVLPEAWVKGVKDGNTVTFAANQYMGEYGSYGASYFFYGTVPVVFTYNDGTYSAQGQVYGVLGDKYYDGNYYNPVLSKVVEMAGTPATPSISEIAETQYGDVMVYNVPVVDTKGNAMVTSKLSYQFFIDDENTPMVFTPEYFTKLTEEMTVIPYGFTENYDIYNDQIYLNMPHDTWTKIGIQSIYTGGGEEHKSEIFWFDMPVKEDPVTAPEGLQTETYTFTAQAMEYSEEGDTEFEPYNILVQVGFDGNDCYIQGLAQDMPELWVKATKNGEGKYVIPANQYMGDLSFYGYTFPYYWTATDEEGNMTDAALEFDTKTSTFTSTQTMALNGAKDALEYYLLFTDVVITKFVEVAATPANPIFEKFDIEGDYPCIYASIPTVGTNGETLNTAKLFYTVWVEKNSVKAPYTFTAALYSKDFSTDVIEVPYSHDGYDIYKGGEIIYFEDALEELQSWTKAGIQSIYYGAGEVHKSAIVWSDGTTDDTGISDISAEKNAHNAIYTLSGQKVEKARKGLYIMNGRKIVMK